jgi:hypothetical protein
MTVRPDVEFLGGTQVRDVLVLSAWTVPHDVYFEARYPASGYKVADVKSSALGYSIVYEDLYSIPGVDEVAWTQIETASGMLQDGVILYVSSTSGLSSDTVTVPYSQLSQNVAGQGFPSVTTRVKTLRAKLDSLEG